jgi:hypothetical protein
MQQPGVGFNETFASVSRMETIRIVLALGAETCLQVDQLHVNSALLNGESDEFYEEQPCD